MTLGVRFFLLLLPYVERIFTGYKTIRLEESTFDDVNRYGVMKQFFLSSAKSVIILGRG